MPSIRIGFTTDFNLTGEQIGIGTTVPTARLDVRGNILADNIFDSGSISTISRYDGFLSPDLNFSTRTTELSVTNKGNLNALSGEIKIQGELTVTEGTPTAGGRLDSLTVTNTFTIPTGGTEEREETPEKGTTRFNKDFGTLEFYTGLEWRTVSSIDGSGRGRGVFGGGNFPNTIGEIEFISLSSGGTSINFGNLSFGRNYNLGSAASSTRGLFAGGYTNTPATNTRSNVIDYITIASEGNSIDFGDRTVTTTELCGCSSQTRGLFAGGFATSNVIDYVQIQTIGNALDFGDLSQARNQGGALASPIRGVFAGGLNPHTNIIDFVTISSTGNAVDFGDLTQTKRGTYGACSNSIRGMIGGGLIIGSILINTIDYITIAATGNATVFGDLSFTGASKATASSTRGVFHQGSTVDSVIIATTGNATRFATLSRTWTDDGALSDSHGGLGGF
jgi:hypothetical protein